MPKCRVVDCKIKYALFNLPGEKQGICCAKHKDDDMIDVFHKKCISENCEKKPSYNIEGEEKPLYCNTHKLTNMIDIISPRCIYDGCIKIPSYNYLGLKQRLYCVEHKLENMIDIKHPKCKEEGCKKIPNFNYDNEIKAIYCSEHKLENMIDIINKTCIFNRCKTRPSYNYEGFKNYIYCSKHKLDGMINIKHSEKCIYDECISIPNFNYENELKAIYCSKHKLDNMIDIKHPKCIFEGCNIQISNPKYQGYCTRCFMYTFPNEPVARNYKIKEKHVTDFVNIHFEEYVESYDKKIQGGCSKRRPDIFIDLFTHTIIIEIDEDNHNNYDIICENKRIMELFEDLANRPIVFIRFNPDKYTNDKGNTIKSCFKYHRISGVPILENEAEWNNRLEKLKNTISKYISSIPEKEVTIEYLFYSEILK